MLRWQPGDDVGALDDWPFTASASEYAILRGTPRASGRILSGGPGHPTRAGIWRCTAGAFSCIEQGDEMMTILSGSGTLTDVASQEVTRFAAGDTLFSRDGRRVIWDVTQDVTKVFFGHKDGGF
ncbi:cupin domain-containing protein [Loktanella sp. 3ANDIMAR09]|uniref:cupin domain-containing protein n=1 Tax=Loktanella sp. 3ANDIMAR09 TaxID=1225657 RepID=UPI0006F48149|nr:cupin domain-containing protein [Loktanella sp. 3ANDIMAR09]